MVTKAEIDKAKQYVRDAFNCVDAERCCSLKDREDTERERSDVLRLLDLVPVIE